MYNSGSWKWSADSRKSLHGGQSWKPGTETETRQRNWVLFPKTLPAVREELDQLKCKFKKLEAEKKHISANYYCMKEENSKLKLENAKESGPPEVQKLRKEIDQLSKEVILLEARKNESRNNWKERRSAWESWSWKTRTWKKTCSVFIKIWWTWKINFPGSAMRMQNFCGIWKVTVQAVRNFWTRFVIWCVFRRSRFALQRPRFHIYSEMLKIL